MRATERITGASKTSVKKLFLEVSKSCEKFQYEALVKLPCRTIQVDELYSFCYAREKNVPAEHKDKDGYGTVWTWIAICADTKIVPCWYIGDRSWRSAYKILSSLKDRMAGRITLISDGHKAYATVIESVFGGGVNYAQLVKQYEGEDEDRRGRYKGAEKTAIIGNPALTDVSTSYIERQNLTMRMHNRRYTRRTNAFSKKIENHKLSVALHFMYYNFVRVHQTLRVTPAMEAGITDRIWTVEDMVKLTYPDAK